MSPSVYDTAWLSMLQKPGDDKQWLFPECFVYVLKNQLPDGSWPSYASVVDGILNTTAALLAIRKHLAKGDDSETSNLKEICDKAEDALRALLREWDVSSCDQVGLELLVAAHLHLLDSEGVDSDFPQREQLQSLRDAKLSKLPVCSVYEAPSTLYHSLEGLVGLIDFDQISRWREPNGSMMGSPSSTAAYLMHASTWDDMAETYLRDVLRNSSGQGSGGVPCAWPTSIFELSWVVTTFVESGISIGEAESSAIAGFLETSLREQKGIVGFAPWSLPDADDTAKTAMALFYLGRRPETYIEALINSFETTDHFRTYLAERNPSISANINVLSCLLVLEDPTPYVSQIAKSASFVCGRVIVGDVKEKWHRHKLYWMMLLAKALSLLYRQTQQNQKFSEHLLSIAPGLREQIPIISLHVLMAVIRLQGCDGGWENECEITAYAVLTLSSLAHLPWTGTHERLIDSINRGKTFLTAHGNQWKKGAYLWTEKVTYSSSILSEAYCLAAVLSPMPSPTAITIPQPFQVPEKIARGMMKAGGLFRRTPLFAQVEPQVLRAAELQACYALSDLQRRRLDIFPRTGLGEDKYLIFIPLTWTACMSLQDDSVSLSVLYDMMVLSMLNYQVDEYMEVVVGSETQGEEGLKSARKIVRQLFMERGASNSGGNGIYKHFDIPEPVSEPSNGNGFAPGNIKTVLGRYVTHILEHPAVINSPQHMQTRLARELEIFLLAHIDHAEDNHRFARQLAKSSSNPPSIHNGSGEPNGNAKPNGTQKLATPNPQLLHYDNPGRTFYNWVRSTSADHTSCPFSFVFFNCLISSTHGDILGRRAKTAYLVEDACRHLASLCRMYNDYGSLARDRDETNLNSVNFPEFATEGAEAAKAELMSIAEYERRGLDVALGELEGELLESGGTRWMDAVRLFVNVTDLYGQIYVVKDIATRMK
ncbi:Ent-kaurene synthase [Hypoxylon crocopeplum]|nr:Ent-kaurene synthase [Hypoxylon crocopeplum]